MPKGLYERLQEFCRKHDLLIGGSDRKPIKKDDFNECGFVLMTTKKAYPTHGDLGYDDPDKITKTGRRQIVCACHKWDSTPLDIETNPLFKEVCRDLAKEFGGKISRVIPNSKDRWEEIRDIGDGLWF